MSYSHIGVRNIRIRLGSTLMRFYSYVVIIGGLF